MSGKVMGWVTSGGYAHYVGQFGGAGLRAPARSPAEDDGFEIEIIGKRYPARPQRQPLFDPMGERMRG